MIRKHKPLILNLFKARNHLLSGVVEGLNNRIKVTKNLMVLEPSMFCKSLYFMI